MADKVWNIYQERCTVAVDLVKTTKSGILAYTDGGERASPYQAYEISDCDEGSTQSLEPSGATPVKVSE